MLWFDPYMPSSEVVSVEPPDPYIEAYPDLDGISTNPTPFENPVRACRKLVSMTLAQLSEATGVHLQAIHLLENGCYTPILPRIEDFFVSRQIISLDDLRDSYSTFQFHSRATFGRSHKFEEFQNVGDWDGEHSPFEEFRTRRIKETRTATAKGLCVQPAALYRLANNEVKELPSLVQSALQEAGLHMDLVYELNERTAEWYYSER